MAALNRNHPRRAGRRTRRRCQRPSAARRRTRRGAPAVVGPAKDDQAVGGSVSLPDAQPGSGDRAVTHAPGPERGPIELDVGGPVTLPLDLPSGVSAPQFTRTNIAIAAGSGRLTAVATGPGAHLALTIAHASSDTLDVGDLVSSLRLSLPVLGETVSVTGALTLRRGALAVALSGPLPEPAVLGRGRVKLAAGDQVRISSRNGLHISGPATLASGRDTVHVVLSGAIREADNWALVAREAEDSIWPGVPGLRVRARFQGTVSDTGGQVRFDVSAPVGRVRWGPADKVTMVADRLEFADVTPPPSLRVLTTFGVGAPWVDVTGPVTVPAGRAGALTGSGTLVIDTSRPSRRPPRPSTCPPPSTPWPRTSA